MDEVKLPRSAVLQLLHQAQLGDGAGFITRLPDGAFRIHPIRAVGDETGRAHPSAAQGETPFAFYRTALQAGPDEQDLGQWRGQSTLFLSVSVGIKGVLQLRGWRIRDGKAYSVAVSLAEDVPAQGSGVSR